VLASKLRICSSFAISSSICARIDSIAIRQA